MISRSLSRSSIGEVARKKHGRDWSSQAVMRVDLALTVTSWSGYRSFWHTTVLLILHSMNIGPLTLFLGQSLSKIDPTPLYEACIPGHHAPGEQEHFSIINFGPGNFAVNPRIPFDASTLYAVQASTFCLTVRLLSVQSTSERGLQHPWGPWQPLLHIIDWFEIWPFAYDREDLRLGKLEKAVVTLHSFANKVVGLFAIELRAALADRRVVNGNIQGLFPPPNAFDIPFGAMMNLPDPFADDGLKDFSTCHLPVMAHPDFFTDGGWTGYFSYTGGRGVRVVGERFPKGWFDGIGGDNDEVQRNGYTETPHPYFPYKVDRSIHFAFIRWEDEDRFIVHSNFFQTQSETDSLRLKVNKRTGMIDVGHHSPFGGPATRRNAVITPFGIVEACLPDAVWLWLWKIEWSASPYS